MNGPPTDKQSPIEDAPPTDPTVRVDDATFGAEGAARAEGNQGPAMLDGKLAVTGAIISSIAGVLSLIAGLFSSVIVARMLGAEGAGAVALALWFMVLATAIADLGWSNVINRFISSDAISNGWQSGLLTRVTKRFALSTGVMAAAILAYAVYLFAEDDRGVAFAWSATALLFLTYAYAALASAAARGLGRFKDAAATTLAGCILQPIGVVLGAFFLGPAGAILGNTLRHLPQAVSLRWYLAPVNGRVAGITESMKRYARNNWHGAVLYASAGTKGELAIIGLYFSLVDVGYYAIGLTVSGLVIQLSAYLQASLLPHFGALHDQDGLEEMRQSFQRSLRWLAILSAPICFGGAAIAPQLIPLVFGEEFVPAVEVSQVLLVWAFVQTLIFVQGNMMLARNHSGWAVWGSSGWDIAALAVMLAFAPALGLLGLAYVKLVAAVASLATCGWFCTTRLDMPTGISDGLKIVLAGVLCAIAAGLCIHWLQDAPAPAIATAIGAGAIVYLAAILMLNILTADERTQMAHRLSKFRSIIPSLRGNA